MLVLSFKLRQSLGQHKHVLFSKAFVDDGLELLYKNGATYSLLISIKLCFQLSHKLLLLRLLQTLVLLEVFNRFSRHSIVILSFFVVCSLLGKDLSALLACFKTSTVRIKSVVVIVISHTVSNSINLWLHRFNFAL